MKLFSVPASMVALVVVVVTLLFAPPLPVETLGASSAALESEKKKGEALVQTLHVDQVLGPLAPIALSPFFALTFMSGASLLADTGLVPDSIAKNALLGDGSPLNNGFVFAGLLALTIVTAVPKLTKVTKPFAQAVDQIEAHSGIVAVIAVQFLSRLRMDEGGTEVASVVIQAGFFDASLATVLMVFSAINIFVVNTVKFFFEMLTFLSPFPSVDAIFEAMNKAVAAFLLSIYLFNPFAATVLNLVIFGICLIIFAWVYRRAVYMRSIFGDPMLAWLGQTFFGRPKPTLTSTRLTGALQRAVPKPTLVLKAFAGKRLDALRTKTRGYLVQTDGRLQFAKRRFMRAPLVVPLPAAGHSIRVEKGFFSNSVIIENDSGDVAMRVLFSRRYNDILDDISGAVGAGGEVVGSPQAAAAGTGVMAVGRTIGAAVKGEGRDTLRAELA